MIGRTKITGTPTERTCAATDIVLSLVSAACAVYIGTAASVPAEGLALWVWIFSLSSAAAILGAAVHGMVLSEELKGRLWRLIYFILGQTVSLFVVAVIYDIAGRGPALFLLPVMIAAGIGFFCITVARPGRFLPFILYQTAAMAVALIGYVWAAIQPQSENAWLFACGILIIIVGSVLQSCKSLYVVLIWPFDHNSLYHLCQTVGIVLLAIALR